MDEIGKVYKPEEVKETPFPQQDATNLTASQSTGGGGTYGATTTQEQPFPLKKTATELLSSVLNTQTKKILGEFKFTPSGAIQIGDYTQGVSGDVKISPAGISARNSMGDPTFVLDGESGNTVFSGEVRSGSSVTGGLLVTEGGSIQVQGADGITVVDEFGLVSTNGFTIKAASGAPNTTFTETTFTDRVSLPAFTLKRSVRALVTLAVVGSSEQVTAGVDCSGRTWYAVRSDIGGQLVDMFYDSFLLTATNVRENIVSKVYSTVAGVTLSAGTHTISLQSKLSSVSNIRSIMNTYDFSVMLLGS